MARMNAGLPRMRAQADIILSGTEEVFLCSKGMKISEVAKALLLFL